MNDFFDSLKEIKKELTKEQGVAKKPQKEAISHTKEEAILHKEQGVAKKLQKEVASHTKEEAILHKEQKLRDEFLTYTKDSNIRKI